jgi:hypothetical protein
VQTADGRTWHVRRRWLPRLGAETIPGRFWGRIRRTVRRTTDLADGAPDPGCLEIFGEGLIAGIAILLLVLLAIFVVVPVLVALLDLLVLLLLLGLGAVARVLLRRPWIVEARTDDEVRTWKVVGWQASGTLVDDVAQRLQAGVSLPESPEGSRPD